MAKNSVIRNRFSKSESMMKVVRSEQAKIVKIEAQAAKRTSGITLDELELIKQHKATIARFQDLADRHFFAGCIAGVLYTELA